MRVQENCQTADFELCKKEGAQFCRPKIFNLFFVYQSFQMKRCMLQPDFLRFLCKLS
jgi:hypothetical protein